MPKLDIVYEPNKYLLSASQKQRIKIFWSDNMESDPQFIVNGFSSSSADHEYNFALSTLRGDEVAEALIELGVPNDRISLRSFGERRFSGNSEALQLRRAVTISAI